MQSVLVLPLYLDVRPRQNEMYHKVEFIASYRYYSGKKNLKPSFGVGLRRQAINTASSRTKGTATPHRGLSNIVDKGTNSSVCQLYKIFLALLTTVQRSDI